jgi:hypothetical protein
VLQTRMINLGSYDGWYLLDSLDNLSRLSFRAGAVVQHPSDLIALHGVTHLPCKDSNFERYMEDTSEIEDFPQVEGFDSKGRSRGMVPATLGIDALDHIELIRRTKREIKYHIDVEKWKVQMAAYRVQRRSLRKLF